MSAVQLSVFGIQDSLVGTLRLGMQDPNGEVRSVGFYVTDGSGIESGPHPADRTPVASVYEKDVTLGDANETHVQPVVTLHDGTVLRPRAERFGLRFATRHVPPGTLASTNVTAGTKEVSVSATPETAVVWKGWLRRGGWPTEDGLATGPVADTYLRFEGDPKLTSFSTTAEPGGWYAVLVGYNTAGQPGPRKTASVEVI